MELWTEQDDHLQGESVTPPLSRPAVDTQTVRQMVLAVVGSFLLWVGHLISNAGALAVHHENLYLSFSVYASAFVLFLVAANRRWATSRWASAWGGAAVALALVSAFYVQVTVVNPNYGTDALALSHVAAEHLLRGDNPYALSGELKDLVEPYGVPEPFLTQTLQGGYIERVVSYPPLQRYSHCLFLSHWTDVPRRTRLNLRPARSRNPR